MLNNELVYRELEKFWSRPYEADVALLNRELKKSSCATAGLEVAPPSVLTGDISRLEPGNCIVVLGKNPAWRKGGLSAPWAKADVLPTIRDHNNGDFATYRKRRARYFEPGNPQNHGGHFTKLGNVLRANIHLPAHDARSFLNNHVAIFDVIPWWSVDTKKIDASRLTQDIEPVRHWHEVLTTAFRHLRPNVIIVHGVGFSTVAEKILGISLENFVWTMCHGRSVRGLAGVFDGATPVIGLPLVTGRGWPGGEESFSELLAAWNRTEAAKACLPAVPVKWAANRS